MNLRLLGVALTRFALMTLDTPSGVVPHHRFPESYVLFSYVTWNLAPGPGLVINTVMYGREPSGIGTRFSLSSFVMGRRVPSFNSRRTYPASAASTFRSN